MNREGKPAENEGEQEDEQGDTHEPISFFLYGRRPGRDPSTPLSAIHTSETGPDFALDRPHPEVQTLNAWSAEHVITGYADGDRVVVEVSDNGPGVPADRLPRIFDRFYRAGTPAQRPGSGLGLAIVSEIAAAHDGTVTAAATRPRGLRVTLAVPAWRPSGSRLAEASQGAGNLNHN